MKRRIAIRALVVVAVLFVALAGTTLFVATTEAGARWVLARIDVAAGGDLNWAQADGTLMSGMRIADVAFDSGDSLLRIQRVEFAWQPWRLLDGSLVLDRVDIAGLRQQTRVASEEVMTEERLRGLLFELPIAIELRAFRADDIEVMQPDGTITAIDSVTGAAQLDGDALRLQGIALQQGEARVDGDLELASDDLALSGSVEWRFPSGGRDYAGALNVGGTLQRPELVHELQQPLRVTSSGTVLSGMFDGSVPSFDLQHELPAQLLDAVGQPDLQVAANVRTSGTAADVAIEGSARAQVPAFAPLDIGFALDWRDATLVIREATFDSMQIGLRGNGQLDTAPLALRFDWTLDALDAGEQLPQLELADIGGNGNVQVVAESDGTYAGALQISALTGTLNGYPLSVTGLASASSGAAAAAIELQAASGANTIDVAGTVGDELAIDWNISLPEPGALWQGLSGTLDGSGSVAGTRDDPQVDASLDGTLQLAQDGDMFALETLMLSARHGAAGNDVDLEIGRLTRTADGATTVLLQSGALALTGTPAEHELRADLEAPADALQLRVSGAFADGNWRGVLQRAELASRAGDWQLEAPAPVTYIDGALALAQSCWHYAQTRLCLQGGMPAAEGFDAELSLAEFPLAWLNAPAAAPDTKPAALQQLQDAFAANLPEGVRTEGLLDAQVTLRNFAGGTWSSLDAVVQPRGLVVEITQQLDDDEETEPLVQRFGFDFDRVEVHSGGTDWAGALDMNISHRTDGRDIALGSLRGSGELAADGSLAGSADFTFRDLAWLESLGPILRSPAGMLNGTIGVSGTREQPQLQARMQLQGGSFDVPQYGLEIREATMTLSTDAANVLRLVASARSGDGQLQLTADARNPLQPDRSVNVELSGADFVAVATEYATVTLSPQLQAGYADELLTVNGSIDVHDTDVNLEGLFGAGGENAVGVSSDVVIVSGEPGMSAEEQDALPIAANVDVRIGDAVHVSGYDLDATLGGELRIEQVPGRPLLVYGELDIPEGRYEIYNQELNARDGRLVFFGNPANPLLDVRAFRELESGEVGVHLTGNLDSIQGRLYSTPTLPDNEALSLLVTGKSLGSVNEAESNALVGAIANFGLRRGEGFTERVGSSLGLDSFTVGGGNTLEDSALGLGKYLTPDLLMRYKLGLFDRQSVLGIEYTLTERLKLEVETGISQSVDLNYTIEKD
ncbi:MAG TPA: translocation/assembly module TamB domain-containing protein [Pseudomonadales bacterium]